MLFAGTRSSSNSAIILDSALPVTPPPEREDIMTERWRYIATVHHPSGDLEFVAEYDGKPTDHLAAMEPARKQALHWAYQNGRGPRDLSFRTELPQVLESSRPKRDPTKAPPGWMKSVLADKSVCADRDREGIELMVQVDMSTPLDTLIETLASMHTDQDRKVAICILLGMRGGSKAKQALGNVITKRSYRRWDGALCRQAPRVLAAAERSLRLLGPPAPKSLTEVPTGENYDDAQTREQARRVLKNLDDQRTLVKALKQIHGAEGPTHERMRTVLETELSKLRGL
jgi:hypothetical protein